MHLSKPMLKHHFPAKFGHSIKKKKKKKKKKKEKKKKNTLRDMSLVSLWLEPKGLTFTAKDGDANKFEYIKGYIPMVEKHDNGKFFSI
jgi:hypothetical protein